MTVPDTPPGSPEPDREQNVLSHQKTTGRKRMKAASRKAYRKIEKQRKTIDDLKKEIRSLKRGMRKINMHAPVTQTFDDSPATKARKTFNSGDKNKVKRALLFTHFLRKSNRSSEKMLQTTETSKQFIESSQVLSLKSTDCLPKQKKTCRCQKDVFKELEKQKTLSLFLKIGENQIKTWQGKLNYSFFLLIIFFKAGERMAKVLDFNKVHICAECNFGIL